MVIHQDNKSKALGSERAVLGTFGALLATTLVSGGVMASMPASADDSTKSSSVSVTVSSACTISSDNTSGISKTINPGVRDDELGTTTMKVLCNNPEGFDIYAVGYSNDTWKRTELIGGKYNIETHLPTDNGSEYTDTSHWYMKLAPSTSITEAATIATPYNDYATIPSDYTLVASHNSATASATDASFTVTYGAYVTSAQLADTYTGKVKYTVVNPHGTENMPEVPYIQDYTLAKCQSEASSSNAAVIDRRDDSDYTVRYINDACWMTQNLRITDTISAKYSNFDGEDFDTMAGGDLRSNKSTYAKAQSHVADSTDMGASNNQYTKDQLGAWYNYCAASAGEVCQNDTAQDATQDICPAGWHLPSYSTDATMAGNIYMLETSHSSVDAINFLPVHGGYYGSGGSLSTPTSRSFWWSSSALYDLVESQYALYYAATTYTADAGKYAGAYIRCVRTE